jgi:two-component sensor histidine kinase
MIVHELSTNALKYGALSNDEGFVDITWNTENTCKEKSLIIDWQEHGGPSVDEPSRSGFGTRLIKRGLGSPQSRTSIDYRDTGLHCRIEGRI